MSFDIKKALKAINVDAEWFGIREVRELSAHHSARDAKVEQNYRGFDRGVMVEVLKNGQFAYAGTNDLSYSSIKEAATRAAQIAERASEKSIHKFSEEQRPAVIGSYETPYQKKFDSMSAGEINNILIDTCHALKKHETNDEKIISTCADAVTLDTNIRFISSNGTDINQHIMAVYSNQEATAKKANIIQKRSDAARGNCVQKGLEGLNLESMAYKAQQIGKEAIELLNAKDCPVGTHDVVIDSDQMVLQVHESIGHPLEMDRILGDERNYAGWSFVKLSDVGNLKYGSDIMNVTFDPTYANEFASYNFDDCGNKATKEHLIKDGLLVRTLGSLESQARSGQPGVANFRSASWNRAPIDRMANINLEPGDKNFDELIKNIEFGVYMLTNRSWSIDDYRNKFQFGCEYGRLIENGKLTKVVKNPNYRGITNQFWSNLVALGDQSTVKSLGSPYCGKGEPNQIIRVGHATPACHFKNIEIFGGQQ